MHKRRPTRIQIQIAKALKLDVSTDSTRVAAARIRQCVSPAIMEKSFCEPATEKQIAYGSTIDLDLSCETKAIASARIEDRHEELNQSALAKLKLKPGDYVIHAIFLDIDDQEICFETEYIVSSVGRNGRVYFKGGNGSSAWPTQLHRK